MVKPLGNSSTKNNQNLVDIILHYSQMQQPITPKAGLALTNPMIKGTELECEMIEWQKKEAKKSIPNSVVDKYNPNYEVAADGC
jgi:hypothetical protein